MKEPITRKRTIYHYNGESIEERIDEIAAEYALTIEVDDEEFATVVCSPADLEELVIGFLASEGIVRGPEQIDSVSIDEREGFARVTTKQRPHPFNRKFFNKRYITSCCGKGRQSFYFYNDAYTAKPVVSDARLSVHEAIRLQQAMQDLSADFKRTGGVHNAALCDRDGIMVARSDIGRHNALDKLYGYCLQRGIRTGDKAIAFSGRISSEVVLKAAKIGSAILLSKSAPTELALNLADELGITAVGFIRGNKLNVYTHPERIAELMPDESAR